MSQETISTYEYEGTKYDASKFNDEGKTLFNYMVEIKREVNSLKRRMDILNAASITLNNKLRELLTDDMLAPLEAANEAEHPKPTEIYDMGDVYVDAETYESK